MWPAHTEAFCWVDHSHLICPVHPNEVHHNTRAKSPRRSTFWLAAKVQRWGEVASLGQTALATSSASRATTTTMTTTVMMLMRIVLLAADDDDEECRMRARGAQRVVLALVYARRSMRQDFCRRWASERQAF